MRPSLRRQLLGWLLIPMGSLVLFDAWMSYRSAQAAAVSVQDRMLLGSARIIAEQVRLDESGLQSDIPPAALELFQSDVPDHVFFRITAADGTLLAGFPDLPAAPQLEAEQSAAFDAVYRGEAVRSVAYAQPVFTARQQSLAVVEVAQTLHGQAAFIYQLFSRSLQQQFIMLLCASALLWIGLQRGLWPVLRLRARMLERRPGALEPLDTTDVPYELIPLTEALNDYVRRLDEHMSLHSRFIANASHQLRTPLTVLTTQVSAALRSPDAAGKDEALLAIRTSVQHGIRLVNQLLSLSAAEARSGLPVPAADVDLVLTVQRVLEDLAILAQSRSIDLGFEQHGEPGRVRGTPTMLRELVANLVDNALRYTPEGGVVTASVSAAAQAVILRVEDNGPGVPLQERERIFERFHRLQDGRSDGCGLGLAIVREIAHACGAQVMLGEPAASTGLVATVIFPAQPAGTWPTQAPPDRPDPRPPA